MAMEVLDPSGALRLLELKESNQPRPLAIIQLEQKIEEETRVLELRSSVSGEIDMTEVRRIAIMKREKDRLYCLWARGELK